MSEIWYCYCVWAIIDYPKRSSGNSWDLLIFFEKFWKSPGINEASDLELHLLLHQHFKCESHKIKKINLLLETDRYQEVFWFWNLAVGINELKYFPAILFFFYYEKFAANRKPKKILSVSLVSLVLDIFAMLLLFDCYLEVTTAWCEQQIVESMWWLVMIGFQ